MAYQNDPRLPEDRRRIVDADAPLGGFVALAIAVMFVLFLGYLLFGSATDNAPARQTSVETRPVTAPAPTPAPPTNK
jgi:hypothetical protein